MNSDKFDRVFGLVPNRMSPPIVSVTYEVRGDKLVDVVREWACLDISNPRAYGYRGPEWKWVVVVVTERPFQPSHSALRRWPVDAPSETEDMRRERIRTIRRAVHVNPLKGQREPKWREPSGIHNEYSGVGRVNQEDSQTQSGCSPVGRAA